MLPLVYALLQLEVDTDTGKDRAQRLVSIAY